MSSNNSDDLVASTLTLIAAAAVLGLLIVSFWAALLFGVPAFLLYIGYRIVNAFANSEAAQERKAREHTESLHAAALAAREDVPDQITWGAKIYGSLPTLPESIQNAILRVARRLYDWEQFELPPVPPVCNSIEGARYRDLIAKVPNPQRAIAAILECARNIAARVSIPQLSGLTFTVPLENLADGKFVESVITPFYGERNIGVFDALRDQFNKNLNDVSGLAHIPENISNPKHILPSDYGGDNIIYAYLKDTPFVELFHAEYPIVIPSRLREEHTFIAGGSGWGKTSLIESLILDDLNSEEQPSIVVIDSQERMINRLFRSNAMLSKNCYLIDPRENPALNIFALNQQRIKRYGKEQREQVYNHTLETFTYLFNSVLSAELTTKQTTLFNYLIQLMLAIPAAFGRNATLMDLLNALQKRIPPDLAPALAELDSVGRDFFEKDFPNDYDSTKAELRFRIQAILSNKTLARLFLAPENRIDFHEVLNDGGIILFDTTHAFLNRTNSSYLGKFAVTLILQAILERAAVAQNYRPIHLYIDEAHEIFTTSIETFLTQARKYRGALHVATQDLAKMSPELRSSVFSNTSIKFVGGVSSSDARALAPDMRTSAEFIMAQKKLHFALYARGATETAVSVSIVPGKLDKEGFIDDEYEQAFRALNRSRVCAKEPVEAPVFEPEPEVKEETKVKEKVAAEKGTEPKLAEKVPPDPDPTRPVDGW